MFKINSKENTIDINEKYINADFSDFPELTDEIRKNNATRTFTGSVRINNGMYRTSAETKDYIKNSLKRKLPRILLRIN